MHIRPIVVVAVLAALIAVPATAFAGKQAKKDICHWDEDAQLFKVINVNGNSVDKHFANHGDVFPSTWYTDADGDGYGDPNGPTDPCPNAGFVNNNTDCNDNDASINPGAKEVCGDNIDNNCSGEIDEGCVTCPCYTTEEINARYQEFKSTTYSYRYEMCRDRTRGGSYAYNYTQVYLYGRNYNPYEYHYTNFYSIDYDYYYYDRTFCYAYKRSIGSNSTYSYKRIYISDAEHAKCEKLLKDWAASVGMMCLVQNY